MPTSSVIKSGASQSSAEHMVCEFHDLKECEDTLKNPVSSQAFAPTTETAERLPASCVINQKDFAEIPVGRSLI